MSGRHAWRPYEKRIHIQSRVGVAWMRPMLVPDRNLWTAFVHV